MLHILSSFALVIVKCLPNDGVCEGLVVLIFDIPIIVLGLENFLVVVNSADDTCCVSESSIRGRHLTVSGATPYGRVLSREVRRRPCSSCMGFSLQLIDTFDPFYVDRSLLRQLSVLD